MPEMVGYKVVNESKKNHATKDICQGSRHPFLYRVKELVYYSYHYRGEMINVI